MNNLLDTSEETLSLLKEQKYKILYRIEHPSDGGGFWNSKIYWNQDSEYKNYLEKKHKKMPNPFDDGIILLAINIFVLLILYLTLENGFLLNF